MTKYIILPWQSESIWSRIDYAGRYYDIYKSMCRKVVGFDLFVARIYECDDCTLLEFYSCSGLNHVKLKFKSTSEAIRTTDEYLSELGHKLLPDHMQVLL